MTDAESILASDLTLVECSRTLRRATVTGSLAKGTIHETQRRLDAAFRSWDVLHLSRAIIERACAPFPAEPIRTLDALHVACAIEAQNIADDLFLLSLDARVRRVAQAVGLELAPKKI